MAKGGKPPADLKSRLPVMEAAILAGKDIQTALEEAKIPNGTMYRYFALHPEYWELIKSMKRGVVKSAAENVILHRLGRKVETEELLDKQLDLAERHYRDPDSSITVPSQVQGAQQINLNFGNQRLLTAADLNDFTDDELELLRTQQKNVDQILADRKEAGKPTKPQRS